MLRVESLTARVNAQVRGSGQGDNAEDRDRDPQRYQTWEPTGVPDRLTSEEESEDEDAVAEARGKAGRAARTASKGGRSLLDTRGYIARSGGE